MAGVNLHVHPNDWQCIPASRNDELKRKKIKILA